MSARLSALMDSYLTLRRSSGYRLNAPEYHIRSFIAWLDENRTGEAFTAQDVIEWACLPQGRPNGHAKRLGSVRPWVAYARAHGADAPLIPAGVLPSDAKRPTPYIYRDGEIRSVMDVFAHNAQTERSWRSRWTNTTLNVLTGFLACTGMRVGEAIALNRADLDGNTGWVSVVTGKTGRERLVLLHPTVLEQVLDYFAEPARPTGVEPEPLFISSTGGHLYYDLYQRNYSAAVRKAGLEPQGRAKPTIHSLRHTFAVNQLAAAYRDGSDPGRRLTLLATWLGHVSPKCTYWYLTATQELLGGAADLIENEV